MGAGREVAIGIGDQIIATGLAKGAWAKRGKKVAFGPHGRIIWDKHSELIFRDNPNICYPGNEAHQKVEWVDFYKGNRGYNRKGNGHWIWNMDWRCEPGEVRLSHGELAAGERRGKGFIVIEPGVVRWKSSAQNKDWGFHRYQAVADKLIDAGHQVVQFTHPEAGQILSGVKTMQTHNFRDALAILRNAKLYVGSEGGMHHGAAAMGVAGVVVFGGFIPPSVTGYDMHTNIAGSDMFCGSFTACSHCKEAMANISVETVFSAAMERLSG